LPVRGRLRRRRYTIIAVIAFLTGFSVPASAHDVTISGTVLFSALDGGPSDHDGVKNGVFTVNDGSLTVSGSVTCNDDAPAPPGASACSMRFDVSGDLILSSASSLRAENRRGGGNGGDITLAIGGNLTLQGWVGTVAGALVSSSRLSGGRSSPEHGGAITFSVAGSVTLEPGSLVAANAAGGKAGNIAVTGAGQISLLGLITSGPSARILSTALTGPVLKAGEDHQTGGSIEVTCNGFGQPGVLVGSRAVIVSQGETGGAGPVTLSGCGIEVKGLVAAVSREDGPSRVALLSGQGISIDGRDFGVRRPTFGRFGRVRADVLLDSTAGSGVDIFANDAIEILGPNPARTALFAVTSNPGAGSSNTGGTVRVTSLASTFTASGNAIQAGSTQDDDGELEDDRRSHDREGDERDERDRNDERRRRHEAEAGKGGTIAVQAKSSIVLDGAFLSAVGDFTDGRKKGVGGTITVQSFAQGLSWTDGGGDVRPVGSRIRPANQGTISLTTCGSSVLTNSQFPTVGHAIPPFPSETLACPATGPVLPPSVVLPPCIVVPTITSPNATTFTVGQLGTFTVTATGVPTPSIVEGGVPLPSGVTFVDNGDGTGTLSGTPAVGTGGAYALTFEATSISGSSGVQNFTLNVSEAPVITSANATTFTVAQAGTFTVTTTGFPTATIGHGGTLPAGVNFISNGDGTGTLSGTPAAGTGGTYPLSFEATNTVGSSGIQTFTLTVHDLPAITSASSTTFTVGAAGSFMVTTTGFPVPSIARGGVALPSGVSFVDQGNGTGTLAGTPAAATGGTYAITFTATNSTGSTPPQNFTLTVSEPPVAIADGPYVTDANTPISRAAAAPDDLLDNDSTGFPVATITFFGAGSLGGAVTDHAAGNPATFGTGGSLLVGTDGSFSFTPSTGFTGSFTFQYRLHNAGGDSDAVVTIQVRPKAGADTLVPTVVGNVSINTAGTPFTVASNDIYNGIPAFAPLSGTTTQGGQVTLTGGTGTFIYNPPPGYQGADSFSYTVTDNSGLTSAAATVSLSVSGMIWFVDNTAGSNGDGRLSNPFNSLQNFVAVNNGTAGHPNDNQSIFLYQSTTAYSVSAAPFALRIGQRLLGQDHSTQTLAQLAGVTLPVGSTLPAMNTAAPATGITSTVRLATNAQVHGLSISTTTTSGLTDPAAAITGVSTSELQVSSTTGTAVALSDLGGALSFVSISASGGANGITLVNTTGSFTVTGDGSTTSVGGNASGGTIANVSGADGLTSGIGIYLNNVQNVALRRMTINGTNQNYAIRGNQVDGFTLEYSMVSGTNGTAATLATPETAGEGSIYFGNTTTNGLSTSGTFTRNIIQGGRARNLSIINTTAGTTVLAIKGNTFGLNQNFSNANQSLAVEARNLGTIVNSTVGGTTAGESNTFTGAPGDLVNFTGQTGTTMEVVFRNNALSNSHAQNIIGGGGMTLATQGTLTFNVDGNTFRGADGSAVTLQKADLGALLQGTISNNTIGATGVAGSGSKSGNGIFGSFAGAGTITLRIANNDIRQYVGNGGLFFDNTGGSYSANFTITGNTTAEPGGGAFAGLAITNGSPGSADTVNVCADVTANDFSNGDPADANDVIVGASGSAAGHTFRLPGFGGSTLNDVQNFVKGNNLNPATTAVTAYTDPPVTPAAFVGGASCPTPP
jgi:hypothetical protein